MSDGRITLAIPDVPPSINKWLSSHWRVRARDKSVWETRLRLECMRWKLPENCERIEAQVTFRFPTRHRRDHDNYTATLSKALGDSLRPEWIPDDNTTRFLVTDSRIVDEVGPKLTTICLDYWRAEELAA